MKLENSSEKENGAGVKVWISVLFGVKILWKGGLGTGLWSIEVSTNLVKL